MIIDILRLRQEPVVYEVDLSPEFLAAGIEEDLRFEAGRGTVTFKMVGEQAMATGELRTTARGVCARCLGEAVHPIRADVHLYYWPRKYRKDDPDGGTEEVQLDEPDCGYYEKDKIEPDEDLRQLLVVETPGILLCDEECKGLCSSCGANLNEGPCSCAGEVSNEPKGKNASWKSQLKNLKLPPGT